MALFSKPPARKSPAVAAKAAAPKAAAVRSPQISARELAAKAGGSSKGKPKLEPVHADESITGASLIEWSPQQQAIEVAQANPGLCAVLENAALLYASGQIPGARALLEQGVSGDHETKQSPLAWLALFDILQRAGDRNAFDQFALQYSVQFERSAPGWEGRAPVATGVKAAGGYIAISGKLTAASAAQFDGLKKAVAKRVAQARLDLSAVTGFDEAGAKLMAGLLAEARSAKLALAIERSQKLNSLLNAAVKQGREGGEGAWQLSLELLQWAHDYEGFDDRAIEFAIAFELSPPSWEPPPKPVVPVEPALTETGTPAAAAEVEAVMLEGVLVGGGPHIGRIQEFAHGRQIIPVNMTAVDRVDFVCAGALLNVVTRVEGQRKAVQIHGASPIIRALLLLIGLSPRHFVRKKG